jgi:hypothetical protein
LNSFIGSPPFYGGYVEPLRSKPDCLKSRPSFGVISRSRNEQTLLPRPSLLISESSDEFDGLYKALEQDIKPRSYIEHIYVADIAAIVWEIRRLRRCKAGIINAAFCGALKQLLEQLLGWSSYHDFVKNDADGFAQAWFTDPAIKDQVSEVFARFQLDESAIEAEAFRSVSSELQLLDTMQNSWETRCNKAIRFISEHRDSRAKQLRENVDRIIDGKDVLRLEHASGKRSSAA